MAPRPTPSTSAILHAVMTKAIRPLTATAVQFTNVTTRMATMAIPCESRKSHLTAGQVDRQPRTLQRAAGEDVDEDREAGRQTRDAAGARDEEARPAVEKARERSVGLPDEHVLAAGPRHHRGQLGVGEGAREAEQPGDHPDRHDHPGCVDVARHDAGLEEHARADDVADDDGGRGQDAEASNEAGAGRREGSGSRHGSLTASAAPFSRALRRAA